MTNFLLASSGCYGWPVIKQIIWLFGYAIKYLYAFLELIGIGNLAVCILLFTLIVKLVLLPMTIKQQKFAKLTSFMQPELSKIQAKYKNTRDQSEAMAMQAEMKEVYAKYGTSQMGGCLQTLIQFPILIALYGVIREAAIYIDTLSGYFHNIIDVLNKTALDLSSVSSSIGGGLDFETQVTALYTMKTSVWTELINLFSGADQSVLIENYAKITKINSFIGIDMSQTPWSQMIAGGIGIIAVLIPIIAGVGQWLSFKLTQSSSSGEGQMAGTMKTMGLFMPLFSVYICFTIQAGVGIYWAISSLFQVVLQILINRYYRTIDMDEFVKANMERAAEKNKKKEEKLRKKGKAPATSISAAAGSARQVPRNNAPHKGRIATAASLNVDQLIEENKAQAKLPPANSLAAKAGLVDAMGLKGDDHADHKKYKK